MNKRNRGITLVALVITIIVLLILAGVSIALVIGDNGILVKARDSRNSSKIGQMKEAVQIAASDVQTAYFGKTSIDASVTFDSEVNYGTLGDALGNQGYQLLVRGGDDDRKVATGDIAFPESDQEPAGFYISDGNEGIGVNINKTPAGTGLVIEYDETDGGIILVDAKPVAGELTESGPRTILHADYLTGYTLIEVKSSNSKKYAYDGNPMYCVKKDANNNYGAYCWIIEGTTTIDDANSKITETATAGGTVDKSTFLGRYDIDVSGNISTNDIMKVARFIVGNLSPLEDISAALKADCNSDYCIDATDRDEYQAFNLGNLITITPDTTEISEQVTATVTYTNYLSLQLATKKVGFGATLAEATSNAENSAKINALTTDLTATSDGYFYAFVEDTTGQRIEKNCQITNVIDTTIDYDIEVINDYAVSGDSSYKLLVIYTNNENSAFIYDNITFLDITNSNYTYNGVSYSKIFALPFYGTDTINNNLIYKKNRSAVTVNELLYDYDVNMTGIIDINDAQACYNTTTIYWTLDNEQRRGMVLNSDANKDKHVDSTDQSLISSHIN